MVQLMNYRRNGDAFVNYLSMTPIHDQHGLLTHYVGIQSDITDFVTSKAAELSAKHAAAEVGRNHLKKRATKCVLVACSDNLCKLAMQGLSTGAQLAGGTCLASCCALSDGILLRGPQVLALETCLAALHPHSDPLG